MRVRAISPGAGAVFAIILLHLAGCAGGDVDSETADGVVTSGEGSLELSLATSSLEGVVSLRMWLYRGGKVDASETPVFESGCALAETKRPQITRLPLADDYALQVDVYADAACTALRYRGARGGMRVTKSGNEGAPYVIPLVGVDAFTALPGVVGRPTDTSPGHFPLNSSRRRIFHAAAALGDGRVVLVGGADSWDGTQLIAGVGQPEIFDSRTMMFSLPPGGSLAGERMMAHAAAVLPDGRLAVAAGVQGFRFYPVRDERGSRLQFDVPAQVCYGGADCPVEVPNFVYSLSFLDLRSGDVTQWNLAHPRVFPTLDLVRFGGVEQLVLAGGVPGYPEWELSDALACQVPTGGEVSCDPLLLVAHRSGQASACFGVAADGVCSALALIGGASSGRAYAEWIGEGSASFTAAALTDGPTQRVILPRAAGAGGAVFATGGILGASLTATDREGLVTFVLDESGAGQFTALAPGEGLPADTGKRVFHTVTPLDGDRILLAGGLDADLRPTAQALVVRVEGDRLSIERSDLELAEARFGHTATRIDGGPLDGAVLIAGGMTADAAGEWELATTTEIFFPAPR